jgi:hypothetical protein
MFVPIRQIIRRHILQHRNIHIYCHEDLKSLIQMADVTCRVVRVTKMTGSRSDDWIY